MPELPEVETIRLSLAKNIIGKTIKEVSVIEEKQFHGQKKDILGKKVIGLNRTGKILAIELSGGLFINIHLKLTGQLLFHKDKNNAVFKTNIPFSSTNKMPGKTTRIIFYFNDNSALFFNDMRKFGWIKVAKKAEEPKSLDVLSPDFTLDYFSKAISKTARPIKIALMDQDKLAGVGNIYANEALFRARINPFKPAKNLNYKEVKVLYQKVIETIKDGIKHKGTTAGDEAYIAPLGDRGDFQTIAQVYQKEGKPCQGCKGTVKRIKQGGRSTFYCPTCQK
ncbi:MAG: bifunctional DNA-formamidopyrimidine glycosylase/DNA-(apurinic or apyrimidinic site) lyase [Candidatus Roizmanbacteria bacterium]|nr:MAG: bifunctional DNA-formamidopyrimidine glycosylase/DNA-(apurinic or apyrimidinic site) lyase [Candidatus Roizmanbacteria bacterium]